MPTLESIDVAIELDATGLHASARIGPAAIEAGGVGYVHFSSWSQATPPLADVEWSSGCRETRRHEGFAARWNLDGAGLTLSRLMEQRSRPTQCMWHVR